MDYSRFPALTETSVTNPPATVLDGSSFSVTDSVQNIGSAAAAASTTRYYLSTTTSKSGARLLTGSRAVPSLASSATSSGTVTVTVSAGTAGGTYFLLACADDTLVVPETNESGRSFDHALLPLHHDLEERRSSADWQPRCTLAGLQRHLKRHCDRDGQCGHGRRNLFLAGLRRLHPRSPRNKREQQLQGFGHAGHSERSGSRRNRCK